MRRVQSQARVPAVSAALHRADRPLWTCAVGGTGGPAPLGPDTAFRIGSVTKTFTAVLVLQCRDDGLLDLDDPIGRHLDLPAHGELTVRRLLSHTAGLQREPYGDVWDTLRTPELDRLVAELARAERVLPAARRYHYSNLGMALLGQAVARLRGGSWAEVLAEKILDPLGLTATSTTPGPAAATGYLVDAYSDHARPEPNLDLAAVAPAAQLWSTAPEMARWAAFLADPATVDPAGAVLAPATLDEMRWPLTVTDETVWAAGFGLGLLLLPQRGADHAAGPGAADRVLHVGHDGAMPGFLAGVYGRRGGAGTPAAMGCAVLGSAGTAGALLDLVHDLLATAAAEDPAEIAVWRPGPPAPDRYRGMLGRWWGEGFEYVFSWHDGALQARGADDPPGKPPAVFEPLPGDPDTLRTVAGRETGELLRLTRDGTGTVVRMHWATYRFTRRQETFDGFDFRAADGPDTPARR
ncbi:serine hydrolase [Solwaraspora sp. WMMD1047]|uniref:serine hydrolase domain-containing protein n=1 Tax=Solwaraspora sp. WMMD1047 TaxID=3016102 RepID=UPI0024166874|nr:serine hydrolase domain-containing protein [Solwaraspora sp. WMMD1047]MDG4832706.1 serine hydrolase [Solwaraspora sp. WMMD1047]